MAFCVVAWLVVQRAFHHTPSSNMDKIKQAQDAKRAADQAKAGGSFMFGDEEIGPPLSPHIILTIIVNFFIAP